MRRRVIDLEVGAEKPFAGGSALDLESLRAAERAISEPRRLVLVLLGHAARIAASERSDAVELALRKVTRAHLNAQELGDRDLQVEALRARVALTKRSPGREALAVELACELVALLAESPGDSRRERALVLVEARSKPWWWYAETRAANRAELAADELRLREALALMLEIGDDAAEDTARIASQLVELLELCRAAEARRALCAELRATSPAVREACAREGLRL